uniref:Chemokine interleukin-8-like domain-containing protein n=1 Tax=Oryzias latipes TaxID=8090 RepID=A0A3B3HKM7_ORYLA
QYIHTYFFQPTKLNQMLKLCCTRYQSTGNHFPVQRLKSYRVQEDTGNCNIRAIIFLTVKGRVFCANPNQQWVIEESVFQHSQKDFSHKTRPARPGEVWLVGISFFLNQIA